MKKIIFILFFIQYCAIYSQDKKYVNLNFSVEYNQQNKFIVSKITYKLKEFIDTKNKNLWIEDKFFPNPDGDFLMCFNLNSTQFDPTILSITNIGYQKYIVKIGFFNYDNDNHYLNCVYNLIAIFDEDEIKFSNIRKYNMNNFETCEVDAITYYYDQDSNFEENEVQGFIEINNNISDFFNLDKLNFKYVKCKNLYECKKLVGYDFDLNMFDNNQKGAFAYPYYKIIFSGNNSFNNTHELVHLYVKEKFGKTNMILNEGLASYFGGSKGFTLEYHLNILKKHIEKNDIDIFNLLFNDNYVIDNNTSLLYTMGGLICKILVEQYGKEELFGILDSAISNEELIEELEIIFNIDRLQFNTFFEKYLFE